MKNRFLDTHWTLDEAAHGCLLVRFVDAVQALTAAVVQGGDGEREAATAKALLDALWTFGAPELWNDQLVAANDIRTSLERWGRSSFSARVGAAAILWAKARQFSQSADFLCCIPLEMQEQLRVDYVAGFGAPAVDRRKEPGYLGTVYTFGAVGVLCHVMEFASVLDDAESAADADGSSTMPIARLRALAASLEVFLDRAANEPFEALTRELGRVEPSVGPDLAQALEPLREAIRALEERTLARAME